MTLVRSGLERLQAEGFRSLRGLRLGLIANPTSVDRQLVHLADLLQAAEGVRLQRIFGPEHGIRGAAQDMIAVDADARDPATGLPVVSLYGPNAASLSPPLDALSDLDALVFDIQDIGARYYTYVWTMALCMRAAQTSKLKFIVLDRPNPIGGQRGAIEGPALRPEFESFVGLHPVATRHSFTAGELALWLAGERGIAPELEIVELQGWQRSLGFDQTGLPWVPPSPNMPTLDTALVYPGQCLIEGTNLSEGRGTTRPFEIFGAPFIDPDALAKRLAEAPPPGVRFRPLWFEPTFHKFRGQSCGGLMLYVTDRHSFRPVRTTLALLCAIRELWGDQLSWRTQAYEFVGDRLAIDLLFGSPRERLAIDAGQPASEIAAAWEGEERTFTAAWQRYLRYPE